VIIPDVNILLYAYDVGAPQHTVAREWWETTLSHSFAVGLPWVSTPGFIRISTNRRILDNPLPAGTSIGLVRSWLARPSVQILTPGERHAEILFEILNQLGTAGNLTTDAHLAALAIEYHAELVSTDADFARFPGLRWFNPLQVPQKKGRPKGLPR
jgi:uncharacterized protein